MHPHSIVCTAGATLIALGILACEEEQAPTAPVGQEVLSVAATPDASASVAALGTIGLPINQSVATTAANPAFGVTQTGKGPDGVFKITNTSNAQNALLGQTSGSGIAVRGLVTSPTGRAGVFESTSGTGNQDVLFAKANNNGTAVHAVANGFGMAGHFEGVRNSSSNTLSVSAIGSGHAISAFTTGKGSAGRFVNLSTSGVIDALYAENNSQEFDGLNPGAAIHGVSRGNARAAAFSIENPNSIIEALRVHTEGVGAAARFSSRGGLALSAGRTQTDQLSVFPSINIVTAFEVARGASRFNGNVRIEGTLTKAAGSFQIDHPLDPEHKYLSHSFVESPEMLNVYDGTAMLDGRGEAVVMLPTYFEALNRDFRYQLTAIGAPGPNLHVGQEIRNNRFVIAGGVPGAKISWQVTGVRQDAYAEAHRIQVETDKSAAEAGVALAH